MTQETFFGTVSAPAPPAAIARPQPAPQDAERLFFRHAGRYLFWTWRLIHKNPATGEAAILERRAARADQMESALLDLRSFTRMSKDPNTYRAVFQSPKLAPTQLQVKILAPAEIEIFQATKDRWEAWYYANGRRTDKLRTPEGVAMTSSEQALLREKVRAAFERQVRAWLSYDQAGKPVLAGAEATSPEGVVQRLAPDNDPTPRRGESNLITLCQRCKRKPKVTDAGLCSDCDQEELDSYRNA
jgi:hypothetical protein